MLEINTLGEKEYHNSVLKTHLSMSEINTECQKLNTIHELKY